MSLRQSRGCESAWLSSDSTPRKSVIICQGSGTNLALNFHSCKHFSFQHKSYCTVYPPCTRQQYVFTPADPVYPVNPDIVQWLKELKHCKVVWYCDIDIWRKWHRFGKCFQAKGLSVVHSPYYKAIIYIYSTVGPSIVSIYILGGIFTSGRIYRSLTSLLYYIHTLLTVQVIYSFNLSQ